MKKSQLSLAVGAALGLTSMVFTPVYAQDLSANQLEEVIVTGSRITRANLVSASPVTQIDAEEFQFTGTTRVEDLVKNLPQVYSYSNSSQQNGATGTATVNLRNLGDERTLVLINGRRMPAGSPLSGGIGADINQIPGALIKQVDVLTGGASATYGSDAVAGVVNFIMVDDFEGVKLDYQYSGYNHDNRSDRWQDVVEDAGYPAPSGDTTDGEMNDLSFIIGGNFDNDRGNATAYATYRKIEPIWQGDRDYSACALSDDVTECYGSSTSPQGRFTDFGATNDFDYEVAGDQFVPFENLYNYGAKNYFQRPDKRYTLGSFAHYDVNEHVEAYTELMYMNDRSVSQVAPSGTFFNTDTLPCSNAFMSDQQFETICGQYGLTAEDDQTVYVGRRNVEGGNRQDDLEYDSFRGVFGLRGQINDTWRYDGYYMYSQVNFNDTFSNDLETSKIQKSLDAVVDPETGEIVCQSALDGNDPACVPYNIFGTGPVTQESLDYLILPLFARGSTDQEVASFYVEGNLGDYGVKLPWANDGVDVVVGAEYRKESLHYNPDQGYAQGLAAGQGGAQTPVDGKYSVKEGFLEASIPLVEGKDLMEQVVLDASYRYSDYDYGETTNTYGFRLGWAFNQQIKARASYQRAVRAPNVQELFQPQGLNLFDMAADPCSNGSPGGLSDGGYTQAQCALSGLQPDDWGKDLDSPAGQYNYLQGGNPDLSPEESDTYTYGVVLTPDFLEGFTLTVDYYDIKIEDGINNLSQEFILTECLEGNTSQCDKVKRGNNGDLWVGSNVQSSGQIVALTDNLAVEQVKGIDVVGTYDFDIGKWGSMNINNVMSYIDQWDTQELSNAPKTECAGIFAGTCGFPTPDLRNNLRATWTTPWSVTASAQWRYIGNVDDINKIRDMNEVNYFDIAAIWDINEWASVRAGVNNVTDKAPPIVGSDIAATSYYGAGNTFPGMYDANGRYFFLGGTISF
ncbi:MAG: TonB-dependent receptor [Halioglobus sp.]|nr:TonB-dependent receptor [Halioglobus sp.]MCB1708305.1 TonB-dependent receptor [Halioglobus sp.]